MDLRLNSFERWQVVLLNKLALVYLLKEEKNEEEEKKNK